MFADEIRRTNLRVKTIGDFRHSEGRARVEVEVPGDRREGKGVDSACLQEEIVVTFLLQPKMSTTARVDRDDATVLHWCSLMRVAFAYSIAGEGSQISR